MNKVAHNVFDPLRKEMMFLNRVAYVFPGDFETKFFELLGFLYDLPDFVTQFFSAFVE